MEFGQREIRDHQSTGSTGDYTTKVIAIFVPICRKLIPRMDRFGSKYAAKICFARWDHPSVAELNPFCQKVQAVP